MKKFLAFDIGASSGRAIMGILDNNKLSLREIYRFPNSGVKIGKSYFWNLLRIYTEIIKGMKRYVKRYGKSIDGIGIDTWGVDFVLLDKNDELVGSSHHYRDDRTKGMLNQMFEKVSKEEIFNITGIQFMEINTSTQLFSMILSQSPQLSISKSFLMIPDYLNYLLTGKKRSEYTIATTSQLINAQTQNWSQTLVEKLGLDINFFKEIIYPGTILGKTREYIANDVGLKKDIDVITTACHDSASAIAAVPVNSSEYNRGEWAYLSSGTWSLLGVELDNPIINKKTLEFNITNEGGVENTIRFLKNVTGLWLIQECKKIWEKEMSDLLWKDIVSKASEAEPFQSFINPDDSQFHHPSNMVHTIQEYCQKKNQYIPKTIGEISRTIFESLAFRYRQIIEILENILRKKIKILFIIGGGSSNRLLNQFTANSLKIPIKVGPVEATAVGNILLQAKALNNDISLDKIREIVRNSFPIKKFLPKNSKTWNKEYVNYLNNIN